MLPTCQNGSPCGLYKTIFCWRNAVYPNWPWTFPSNCVLGHKNQQTQKWIFKETISDCAWCSWFVGLVMPAFDSEICLETADNMYRNEFNAAELDSISRAQWRISSTHFISTIHNCLINEKNRTCPDLRLQLQLNTIIQSMMNSRTLADLLCIGPCECFFTYIISVQT